MLKRAVIGILWAYATYTGWKVSAGIFELAQSLDALALIVSLMLGAVVAINPFSAAWQPRRRIARVPDPAVPGESVPAPDHRG
jgi:hypothetical protein